MELFLCQFNFALTAKCFIADICIIQVFLFNLNLPFISTVICHFHVCYTYKYYLFICSSNAYFLCYITCLLSFVLSLNMKYLVMCNSYHTFKQLKPTIICDYERCLKIEMCTFF